MRKQVVLIVDDEPDIRNSLRELLESSLSLAECLTASNGREAIEMIRKEPVVDLLLVDYRMPGMDGVALLMEARQVLSDVPRILITAYPDLHVAIRAINDGHVKHFLTKPLDANQLVELVRTALFERRLEELRNRAIAHFFTSQHKETTHAE